MTRGRETELCLLPDCIIKMFDNPKKTPNQIIDVYCEKDNSLQDYIIWIKKRMQNTPPLSHIINFFCFLDFLHLIQLT